MKEFLLLIRNEIGHQASWSPARHEEFVRKCEEYIGGIKEMGKMIAAQPLVREGTIVSRIAGVYRETAFNEGREILVGYYHIRANDLSDAVAIAKGNPEFGYSDTARIEVRPIKTKESETGFTYPKAA